MKKSRYIAQLMDKAEERKKEESIIFDRRRAHHGIQWLAGLLPSWPLWLPSTHHCPSRITFGQCNAFTILPQFIPQTSVHCTHSDSCVHGRKKKEQEVEAHLFGDKPVYVTNAYRKHQEEQAKYEAELDKRCASPPVPSACWIFASPAENRGACCSDGLRTCRVHAAQQSVSCSRVAMLQWR